MTENEFARKQPAWELDATASALAANLEILLEGKGTASVAAFGRAQELAESLQVYARAMQAEQCALPLGFSIRAGEHPGLWHTAPPQAEGDNPVETRIGSPLYARKLVEYGKDGDLGLLLEWRDPDDNLHSWVVPIGMLGSRGARKVQARLVHGGWEAAVGDRARRLLVQYLQSATLALEKGRVPQPSILEEPISETRGGADVEAL